MADILVGIFGIGLIVLAGWLQYRRVKWVMTGKGHPLIKDVDDGKTGS